MLNEETRRAVIEFELDADDAKDELDSLARVADQSKGKFEKLTDAMSKGFEKATASAKRLGSSVHEGLKSGLDKLDDFTKALGPYNQAFELLGKAADYAKDALKEAGEYARLTAATTSINIDRLSDAFHDLVTEHDLLTFAAKASHGQLELNQEEMETVGKAAVALQARGFDLHETLEKLTNSAVKGTVEGLDDLGLKLENGESKAQTLKNVMAELNRITKETGPITETTADSLQRASKQWDDMAGSIKRASAELFIALDYKRMQIELEKELQERQGYVPDEVRDAGLTDFLGFDALAENNINFRKQFASADAFKQWQKNLHDVATGIANGKQKQIDKGLIEMPEDDRSGDVRALQDKRKADAKKAADEIADILDAFHEAHSRVRNVIPAQSAFEFSEKSINEDGLSMLRGLNAGLEPSTRDFRYQDYQDKRKKSVFDALGIDKEGVDNVSTGTVALNAFKDAFAQTVEAISTGSMTAGQAFKKGIGLILNAVGQKLVGLGTGELIEAAAHAALLDPLGAAKHLAAAAIYTGGAGLLFAAGAKLGGGGGSSTPSVSAGGSSSARLGPGPSSSGSGSGDGGGDKTYIIVGDSQADDSPRIRQRNAERTVALGLSRTSTGGAF